jgi:hypothetical protein
MRSSLALTMVSIALIASTLHADDDNPVDSSKSASKPVPSKKAAPVPVEPVSPDSEAEALAFVRENHAELSEVLGVLNSRDQAEYRKAISELSQICRSLAGLKARNPRRYEVDLEVWKAKSRVELLAARQAGSPGEDLRSQLRLAIEAKLDADIRRQRFLLEQAEDAANKARGLLRYLEADREAIIDARLRAVAPKKTMKPKKPADSKPAVAPSSTPASAKPANPTNGEDRP